ncbi:MAG: nuclear transport factor 2 family protein, partial [Croceitalea sp.]|nr:nuclear transport factor 2 family protein [Croceitalea sp.]
TYQFVDGKIVREVGYWDASALALEMQSLAMAENTEDME